MTMADSSEAPRGSCPVAMTALSYGLMQRALFRLQRGGKTGAGGTGGAGGADGGADGADGAGGAVPQ